MGLRRMKSSSIPIVLASGSHARRHMLEQAGVSFTVEPARIDEAELMDQYLRHTTGSPVSDIAQALADAKALDVSARHVGAVVIGSDQIAALGERVFTKATDRDGARRTLVALRGQTHQLHSAVALACDGQIVWRHVGTANLTMRDFSDAFLDVYLDVAGGGLTQSVGAYEIEGVGLQLFDVIDGDYFTILGMPLLPVLAALRSKGGLVS
jgi:septum formation protein